MSRTEAAIRRAGATVALTSACVLMRIPAPEAHEHVMLALHALFLLGCAAVANLARRAAEAARGMALGASAAWLRRVGFAGVLLYALYYVAAGDVRAEASSVDKDKVKDILLFIVFLVAVWAVYLSMVTGRGGPQPLPEEEELDGGEVGAAMAPRPAHTLDDSKL